MTGVKEQEVTFGRHIVGVGVSMGVAIAIAVPAVVLTLGRRIPGWMLGLTVIVAVLVGGAVTLTSVFFGIVIPRRVGQKKTTAGERGQSADETAEGPEQTDR